MFMKHQGPDPEKDLRTLRCIEEDCNRLGVTPDFRKGSSLWAAVGRPLGKAKEAQRRKEGRMLKNGAKGQPEPKGQVRNDIKYSRKISGNAR